MGAFFYEIAIWSFVTVLGVFVALLRGRIASLEQRLSGIEELV